ncbi:hypothetical protein [Comamonas sp. MYb69]|uniref:hypothetical protein n=1 Tax=Comamonas sp. MYb69 TaxID=1848650 RepID=UPI00309B3673
MVGDIEEGEAVRLLVTVDADVDVRDFNGNSLPHDAISMRQTCAAKVLIASGSDGKLGIVPENRRRTLPYLKHMGQLLLCSTIKVKRKSTYSKT